MRSETDTTEIAAPEAPLPAPVAPRVQAVAARRVGRTWAGLVGAVWPGAILLGAFVQLAFGLEGLPTVLLLLGLPLMLLAYGLGAATVPRAPEPPMTPLRFCRLQALEKGSLVWPAVGLSVLGPLTLHAWIWALRTAGHAYTSLAEFDVWMLMSVPLTVAAHATLGYQAAKDARARARLRIGQRPRPARYGRVIGLVSLAGLLPGVFLFGIPPLIVFGTSLLLVPMIFGATRRRFTRERAALLEAATDYHAQTHPEDFTRQLRLVLGATRSSDEDKAQALGLLAALAPAEQVREEVLAFLDAHTERRLGDERSLACALELCEERAITPPPQVSLSLARHAEPTIAERAVLLLARTPDPVVQSGLRCLVRHVRGAVQLATIETLAAIGGREVIDDLAQVAHESENYVVRREARAAMRAIQRRLGGVLEAATLSFPAEVDERGALSAAPTAASPEGSLTLSDRSS